MQGEGDPTAHHLDRQETEQEHTQYSARSSLRGGLHDVIRQPDRARDSEDCCRMAPSTQ